MESCENTEPITEVMRQGQSLSTIDIPRSLQGTPKLRATLELMALLTEITADDKAHKKLSQALIRKLASMLYTLGFHGCSTHEEAEGCAEHLVALRTCGIVGKGKSKPTLIQLRNALRQAGVARRSTDLRVITKRWNATMGTRLRKIMRETDYELFVGFRKKRNK